MIFRKLKAATTLAALLIVLFVGAVLITPSPVQAGDGCSAKKETKSCDKSQDKEQKKDQDQEQDKDQKQDQDKSGCSKK